ncbi:MAG: B12-binding domain-containing radical SAM protein [Gammaproteobacteria bacterium]|nr:B12-binding domain-containing radical SAM protein [Gammaproteobacteria bacterium]
MMRLTLIHPSIGKRVGERYIRTWQMEPLPPALLAGLTPPDVAVRFHDDRMEPIPYDEPTDLVALSVETYTALRAYQIASEYRKRRVPVVMGGFHATLCSEEVSRYAEAVVVGEAEEIWPAVVDDARHGRLEKSYHAPRRPPLGGLHYDRRIFAGKRYLPIGLVEAGRGCRFQCDFCAIQSFFSSTHSRRPTDEILAELRVLREHKKAFFFVDDNFASSPHAAKSFLRALAPLRVRWVTQMSINAAHDEEFVALLRTSGCQGVLIGFESLDRETLHMMRKDFNATRGGYEPALDNLRQHGIRVYGTFVFGYDNDTAETFAAALAFAKKHNFYITAFNHLTPFPGTPLYERLRQEGRLLYEQWWLDERYRYNHIPFVPKHLSPQVLREHCLQARRDFYSTRNILRRGLSGINRSNWYMFRNFFLINAMHRAEIRVRNLYPLGDESWQGSLIPAQ